MLSKDVRYEVNIEKSTAFLYHSNKQLENEVIKFTIGRTTTIYKESMAGKIVAFHGCPCPSSQNDVTILGYMTKRSHGYRSN